MTDITSILGGEWSPTVQYCEPAEAQIADAMRAAGVEPPKQIKIDGQLHRFPTKGRKKDDSGWYVFFPEAPVAGRFGCWRDSIDSVFRCNVGRELTAAEKMAVARRTAEAKAHRDEARKLQHDTAASTVEAIWTNAGAASGDHPYLQRKGIQPHGVRITGDGRLIVPMYADNSELSSLQYIDAEGDKKYHPGGRARDRYWVIGSQDGNQPIFIAEGFATAATVKEVTNCAVAIAFSAGNMTSVTGAIREQYGETQEIIIVADNDESGVGLNSAEQASARHGGRIVCPPERGDANDYHAAGGDLAGLLFPPVDDWLIPADEFSEKPAPISWLVKRWIQRNSLIMVHGPSGSGKTFIVLDWCLHMAAAKSTWMGEKVRAESVVYLAGEGHNGLKGRIAAWKQHHGSGPLDMWLSKDGCDLNTASGYQRVVDHIRGLPSVPAVIVVDTLHRFLLGDENSAQDAKTMLDSCSALMQEFGCSVLLVHHTGVAEEAQHRARGSSAWKGALEIEISVVPPKHDGGSIQIIQRKSKDAETANPHFLDLTPVPINGWLDEDGEQVSSAVITAGKEPESKNSEKNSEIFMKAWFLKPEFVDGAAVLSSAVWGEYLKQNGSSESTIKSYMSNKGPLKALLDEGVVTRVDQDWVVVSPELNAKLFGRGKER